MLDKQWTDYEVRGKNKDSYLFCMDDMKLFSRNKTELQQELAIVKTFSDNLRTDFNVFLTVHLSIILALDQLKAQILVF